MKTISGVASGAIVLGVTLLVTALSKLSQVSDDVAKKAQELSGIFNDTKSDITNYKDQVEDLYKTINSNSSSMEEVTNARKSLMEIQDALIKKFGDEKDTIDIITKAVQGQTDAWDDLIESQWQATKNEFNKSDGWNDFANWQEGYSDNIDRMVDEMENAWGNIKLSQSDYYSGDYSDIINKLESNGWQYNISAETFIKGGSTEDLYEEIIEIQKLVGEDMPDNFLKSLTDDANKFGDTLENYESMWDTYVLRDRIFPDENLAGSWKEVNDAYSEYQKAIASGDDSAVETSISNYAQIINTILDDENVDDSVKDYFKDMYPALYREVEKWEFKTNIIPEFDTSGLKGKTQADIIEMTQTDGIQEGEDTFNSIVDSAIEYGIITDRSSEQIQRLLDLLVEWGILQGTIADKVQHTASSFDDIFSLEDSSGTVNTLGELNQQLDKIQSAYNALNDAVDTYNQNGYITIDQFQGIIEQSDDFLDYLQLEDGQLSVNEQAMYDLANARIYAMKCEIIAGLIDNLNGLTQEADLNKYLASTNYELAESYEVQAQAALDAWKAKRIEEGWSYSNITKAANYYMAQVDKVQSLKIGFGLGDSSSAAKDAKEVLDAELKLLEAQFKNATISYNTYINNRKEILDKYYAEGKIAADEYYEYLGDLYQAQIDAMDMALNAVHRKLDDQIKALEDQKKTIEESYQLKIDVIQEEIDKLREESDETKKLTELEQARYIAEKARNQRTKKLYNGQEVIYQADADAIRDAESDLADKELDYYISKLEKEIESLEKELGEATKVIDDQIETLNDLKEAWGDITKVYDEAQEDLIAAEIFGADWEKRILEGRTIEIENFKTAYIAAQEAMAQAAEDAARRQAAAVGSGGGGGGGGDEDSTAAEDWWVYKQIGRAYKGYGEAYSQKQFFEGVDDIIEQNGNYYLVKWLRGGFESSGLASSKISSLGGSGAYKRYHKGLDEGYVGDNVSDDQRLDILQKAGNGDLDPDEFPSILKKKELVFTEEQQKNILSALLTPPANFGNMITRNIKTPKSGAQFNKPQAISFTVGDIYMEKVNDVDGLSRAIVNQFPNKMLQAISKR